jgi:hypothetical protein
VEFGRLPCSAYTVEFKCGDDRVVPCRPAVSISAAPKLNRPGWTTGIIAERVIARVPERPSSPSLRCHANFRCCSAFRIRCPTPLRFSILLTLPAPSSRALRETSYGCAPMRLPSCDRGSWDASHGRGAAFINTTSELLEIL